MYVIEITPHPDPYGDCSSVLLRFPSQIGDVGSIIDSMLEGFAFDEDAEGPEPWEAKVEVKDVPLDDIVSTMEDLDEHWRREIDAAIARGETCSDWPREG